MNTLAMAEFFNDKTVLVTGGTGSFGEYLVRHLLKFSPRKIIVFSRDEWKQHILRRDLSAFADRLTFSIGDVRNFSTLLAACRGVDIIYHAAAMKHVPICEENPMEAVYTNVHGAFNLREAAIQNGVQKVIAISTDKAVRSVNVMGMTKAIQERILLFAHKTDKTLFTCVRFGNVVGSRGSVVPLFKDQIDKKEPLTITESDMTRFLISLEDAMDLVFTATTEGKGREIFVKKMPVARITDIAAVMSKALTGREEYPMKRIGSREGEQLYEALVSEEEMHRAVERNDYFVIYPYGERVSGLRKKYNEYRTDLAGNFMDRNAIIRLLKKTGWI
ncbi:polysaccharide biosynthesis protein [Candidatus Gottesmanbacteria bacterium]|nr:polysaccharide biosynthesis protein [Candidatus Gottesmanbacteria bacterium]